MVGKRTSPNDYIRLGRTLQVLDTPSFWNYVYYNLMIIAFKLQIEKLDLPTTKAATDSALDFKRYYTRQKGWTESTAQQMETASRAINAVLESEIEKRQLLEIRTASSSQKLREFLECAPLTPTQMTLGKETTLCIEIGAYRAAAVSGWSFAYDCVRRWMFDSKTRKSKFNGILKSIRGGGKSPYPRGVVKYSDFYSLSLSERQVLDAMRDARLLSSVYTRLSTYLRERNQYAHANNLEPSAAQANRYIDNLIDVLSGSPFELNPA